MGFRIAPWLAAWALCACNAGAPAVSSQEKARLLTETLDERAECADFRLRLAERSGDAAAIAQIYDAAKKAGCLKRDI